MRHGVPLGIEGLLACESSSPDQLLHEVRPFVELPPAEKEAVGLLRANAGKWEWDATRQKFSLTGAQSP